MHAAKQGKSGGHAREARPHPARWPSPPPPPRRCRRSQTSSRLRLTPNLAKNTPKRGLPPVRSDIDRTSLPPRSPLHDIRFARPSECLRTEPRALAQDEQRESSRARSSLSHPWESETLLGLGPGLLVFVRSALGRSACRQARIARGSGRWPGGSTRARMEPLCARGTAGRDRRPSAAVGSEEPWRLGECGQPAAHRDEGAVALG
jgi:hypothetical protein